ncbi:MAG: hypothetical protein HY658_13770, partial [Actinobacteria bacterium]|nr:hypothetical protein [Actinomycetota bacterium]
MRRRPGGERPVSATESRDREFRGAVVYGAALAVTALLAYLFNAFLGRRLGSRDFATFGALLAALLALGGPVTALFGGAAMAAAREGRVPRPRWPRYLLIGSLAAAALALLPVPVGASALAWFAVAMMMWLLNAWNRGLLTGLGRLGAVGGSIMFEGLARIGFVLVLVTVGWGVSGAAAGLALGISAAVGLSYLLLPGARGGEPGKLAPEVWASIVGLLFLGAVQFADVIAVRVVGSGDGGPYVAASFLARVALYAQIPAAAYALRKAAVAGPRV